MKKNLFKILKSDHVNKSKRRTKGMRKYWTENVFDLLTLRKIKSSKLWLENTETRIGHSSLGNCLAPLKAPSGIVNSAEKGNLLIISGILIIFAQR
jgi:hypothetical protein